jgi:hypothetical protein
MKKIFTLFLTSKNNPIKIRFFIGRKIMSRFAKKVLFTSILLSNVFAAAKQPGAPVFSPVQKPDKPLQIEPLKRSISLDTGYLPSLNSNRAIGEFDLELRQAWGALYDWQNDEWRPSDFVGRSILYSLFSVLTWGPTMGQMATYHELGHSTRFRSIGIDTSFINIGKAAWSVYQNGVERTKVDDCMSDNYFSTGAGVSAVSAIVPIAFLNSGMLPRPDRELLFVPKDIDQYYDVEKFKADGAGIKKMLEEPIDNKQKEKFETEKDYQKRVAFIEWIQETFTPKTVVLSLAGGLNNQQDQSRRVVNHLWYSGGDHFTTVGTYFWDKTWAGFQSASSKDRGYDDGQDTSFICNAYKKMSIDLTHEEIIKYSYLSYFLSAQTYANIYQIYKTISEGENRVYAPEVCNIKLPNVALYFTTKGPTYNVSSGYRYDDMLFFLVSVEFGLKESAWEANIGVRKKFPSFHDCFVHAEVVFNSEAVGGAVYGGAIFDKMWNVQAGIIYHNAKTFQGERNIPSYKSGDTDIEVWVKLGIVY